MTKFLFHGLVWSLGVLIIAFGTICAIIKVDQICDISCINKHFEEAPPFLKIKKLGVHKQICSAERQFFSCKIDKSCMELHLAQSSYSCRELLSKISGDIHTRDLNKTMRFQGNSGLLNYQDGLLNIYDCRFRIDPTNESENLEDSASGGMKTLSLSLLRK